MSATAGGRSIHELGRAGFAFTHDRRLDALATSPGGPCDHALVRATQVRRTVKTVVGLTLLLAVATGCRSQARTRSPQASGTSRIVVHSTMATPVGITIREAVGIDGLSATAGSVAARPPKSGRASDRGDEFATIDAFPAELECPLRTLCAVAVRKRVVALVFAFEPEVEIDLEPATGPSPYVLVHYRDPTSESAALGSILAASSALRRACESADARSLAELRDVLRKRAKRDRRPVVRDSARLALVTEHCGTTTDAALAESVLHIEPTSPALGLWTGALWRASEQLGHRKDAIAAIEAVIERHPDPDVGALLLLFMAFDAEQRGDKVARERLDRRLAEAPFAATTSARAWRFMALANDPLRVGPGDALPAVALRPLDGTAAIATDDASTPQLLYFSASWCRGCIESLPKLRRFADAHPDVRIVYVLWDALDDAQAFVRNHDPVPGTVVRADRGSRKALESAFMKLTVLPTFVLADREGRVITTSTQHSIADLDDVLRN